MLLFYLMNLDFSASGADAPPEPEPEPTPTVTTPSGVKKKKPTKIRFSEFRDHEELGDFLKRQLREKYPELYDVEKKTPFDLIRERDEKRRLKVIQRREAKMRRDSEELQLEEEKRRLAANNQILILLLNSDT